MQSPGESTAADFGTCHSVGSVQGLKADSYRLRRKSVCRPTSADLRATLQGRLPRRPGDQGNRRSFKRQGHSLTDQMNFAAAQARSGFNAPRQTPFCAGRVWQAVPVLWPVLHSGSIICRPTTIKSWSFKPSESWTGRRTGSAAFWCCETGARSYKSGPKARVRVSLWKPGLSRHKELLANDL